MKNPHFKTDFARHSEIGSPFFGNQYENIKLSCSNQCYVVPGVPDLLSVQYIKLQSGSGHSSNYHCSTTPHSAGFVMHV